MMAAAEGVNKVLVHAPVRVQAEGSPNKAETVY